MTNAESTHLETLEALLAEKRKLEGYLAKLEERRAGTPEHVFQRLRDEYLTKLTDAQVRASAEAESLSGGLEKDEAAVREVEARLTALEEEKVEGELRAAVGEFEQGEWEKRLGALTASIAAAEKERDSRRAVYERTRGLLAEARGNLPTTERAHLTPAPEGPSAPPEPTVPTVPAVPAAPAAEDAAAVAPKLRATTAISGAPKFDDLEFLNTVVGRPSTPTPSARPIIEGGSAPLPRPISEGPSAKAPAPAPAPPRAPTPQPPAPVAPQLPLAVPESVAAPNVQASPAPAPAPAPAQEPEEEEESAPTALGRPTPRTSQAIKTLKCAECGSLNYPTEWYCERCGGELAAL